MSCRPSPLPRVFQNKSAQRYLECAVSVFYALAENEAIRHSLSQLASLCSLTERKRNEQVIQDCLHQLDS